MDLDAERTPPDSGDVVGGVGVRSVTAANWGFRVFDEQSGRPIAIMVSCAQRFAVFHVLRREHASFGFAHS
jgi:hypothetical protein